MNAPELTTSCHLLRGGDRAVSAARQSLQGPPLAPPWKGGGESRRRFLATAGMAALGWAMSPRSALAALSVRPHNAAPPDHVLVNVFLRGGADGLSLVAPYFEDAYYRSRPTLAIVSPGSGKDALVDLDGRFGLHPALAPLHPLYESGEMAIVHACGSGDQTRSHFEAMATMERGISRDTGPASGWLARHLQMTGDKGESPLRAIALGPLLPDSLRGAPNAAAILSFTDLQLHSAGVVPGDFDAHLASLYSGRGVAEHAGQEALSVLRSLSRIPTDLATVKGSGYANDDFAAGLRQTALLMKSGIGLEVACLDHYGFDTHVAQGGSHGALASQLKVLASGLAAFAKDLGPERWKRTTVVVESEFGRRVEENSGAGTDHGRGGVMFVLGGGVRGGRIYGAWPGLSSTSLEGPGDLRVTTDYRQVLAEVLEKRMGNENASAVFPGLATPAYVGLC